MPVINTGEAYRLGDAEVVRLYAGDVEVWPVGVKWPVGMIVHYSGATIPKGWAICDGAPHGSSELAALLGSPNTPNLTDMFVCGSGTAAPLDSGGADSVTLGVTQMPAHTHAAGNNSASHSHSGTSGGMSAAGTHTHYGLTGTVSAWHTHYMGAVNTHGSTANHTHDTRINEGVGEDADGAYVDSNPDSQGTVRQVGTTSTTGTNHVHLRNALTTSGISAAHYHNIGVNTVNIDHTHSIGTSGVSIAHSHTVTSEGGGAAVPLTPAHYALLYIIRL